MTSTHSPSTNLNLCSPKNNPVKNILSFLNVPITSSSVGLTKVNILNTDTPIEEGFQVIVKQLSAPVYDIRKNEFVGIIDLKHFLSYILYKMPFPPTGQPVKNSIADLEMFPFHTLDKRSSVLQLLKYFDTGVHRAFVLNETKQIEMINQLSILKWFRENIHEFGGLEDKDIKTLEKDYGLHSFSKVYSINEKEPIFKAFQELHKHDIYGMPIVDDKNHIVGNISIHDIKSAAGNLDKLSLPLNLYFKERPIYTCEKDSKLSELFNIFYNNNIHRIHMVEKGVPVGIVTITDIVSMIYNYTMRNHHEKKSTNIEM